MGFLSSLLTIEIPHRIVATQAKDYCIRLSVSDTEINLMNKLQLDKEKFVYARNAFFIKLFNNTFEYYSDQTVNKPNATIQQAHSFFQQRLMEYHSSAPESEQTKMGNYFSLLITRFDLNASTERLYFGTTGMELDSLSPDLQTELNEVVQGYIPEVASFFKKNLPKLLR